MRGFCFALVCAFSLSSCLEANKVAPLAPGKDNVETQTSVTLSLPRATLAELGTLAQQLVIRVFKVENGALGTELRDAYKFQLTDDGTYALEGLPLGEIEFQVSLVDENNQSLADGSLRAVINPGAQILPKLILKPKKTTAVDLNLSAVVNLVGFPGANPSEPTAVRTVLKRCQGCHVGGETAGGLNLKVYPYTNTSGAELKVILGEVVEAITSIDGQKPKMPPSGTLKVEDITTMNDFLKTVTDASSGSKISVQKVRISLALGGSGRLESDLVAKEGSYVLADRVNLLAGTSYKYTLTVFGPGGSKLYEAVDSVLGVPLDGKVQLKLDVVYQAPTVTLPVVVE